MTDVPTANGGIVFTPSVKAIQQRKGSRTAYARMEQRGFAREISPELAEFIAQQRSFFLATASAAGQPYIQHRGGPPGFLRTIDSHTLGFVDFKGNRQFITQGNLVENPLAFIFLMDFAARRRIKLWGSAQVVENDPDLTERLFPDGYRARPEQVVLFRVTAWDENCPQHIPQLLLAEDVANALAERDRRIAELEAALANRDR